MYFFSTFAPFRNTIQDVENTYKEGLEGEGVSLFLRKKEKGGQT